MTASHSKGRNVSHVTMLSLSPMYWSACTSLITGMSGLPPGWYLPRLRQMSEHDISPLCSDW